MRVGKKTVSEGEGFVLASLVGLTHQWGGKTGGGVVVGNEKRGVKWPQVEVAWKRKRRRGGGGNCMRQRGRPR